VLNYCYVNALSSLRIIVSYFVPQLTRRDDAYCKKCKNETVPGVSVIAMAQSEAIQFIIKDFWIASCSRLAVAMTDNRSTVLHNDEKPVNWSFTKSVIVRA
jgi:hypothetical protein